MNDLAYLISQVRKVYPTATLIRDIHVHTGLLTFLNNAPYAVTEANGEIPYVEEGAYDVNFSDLCTSLPYIIPVTENNPWQKSPYEAWAMSWSRLMTMVAERLSE